MEFATEAGTEAGFVAVSEERNDFAILGRQGFLDDFTATFDGVAAELTLTPNRTLPAA